jgi:hypothetical protein
MDYIDLVQWPAMILTAAAAWLVGSLSKITQRRLLGLSREQCPWVIWSVYARAYALIVLQVVLAALNIRGVQKMTRTPARPFLVRNQQEICFASR